MYITTFDRETCTVPVMPNLVMYGCSKDRRVRNLPTLRVIVTMFGPMPPCRLCPPPGSSGVEALDRTDVKSRRIKS